MATPFTLTSETVYMLISLVVIALGALLAFLSLAAAARARAAAADGRRTADAVFQNNRDLERLIGDLQRQVGGLRDEIANLTALKRSLATARVEAVRAPAPAAAPAAAGSGAPAPIPSYIPEPTPLAAEDDEDGRTITFEEATGEGSEERTVLVGRSELFRKPQDEHHGMTVLRVVAGSNLGETHVLPFDRSTIGRSPTNRIVLGEEKASRIHAEVRYENNRFVLKDHGSTNGTRRNGEPITEVPLEFGDRIGIGATELLFTSEGFELAADEPEKAIAAYERMLELQPDFVPALQNYAFLLERDVARRGEAAAVWDRLKRASK